MWIRDPYVFGGVLMDIRDKRKEGEVEGKEE